jgi:Helix-turn-helix domain
MTPAYLRPKDAAAYMSVNPSTLYRLLGKKILRARVIEGVRLIPRREIDDLVLTAPVAEIGDEFHDETKPETPEHP